MDVDKNAYRHDTPSLIGMAIEKICNGKHLRNLRRAVFKRLPFLIMESEVKHVVYINWLVDTARVERLVPEGLELIEINGKTLISILTYQHGNLRPKLFSFVKFLFPSPLQSNWRLYTYEAADLSKSTAVLFLKNIMNQLLFAIGTRVSSDAMQTHHCNNFQHQVVNEQVITEIVPKQGSAPQLRSRFSFAENFDFPIELLDHFGAEFELLKFLCIQDISYAEGDDFNGLCKAHISLPIDLTTVKPLQVAHLSLSWLTDIVDGARPFAFIVPSVKFQLIDEQLIKIK